MMNGLLEEEVGHAMLLQSLVVYRCHVEQNDKHEIRLAVLKRAGFSIKCKWKYISEVM